MRSAESAKPSRRKRAEKEKKRHENADFSVHQLLLIRKPIECSLVLMPVLLRLFGRAAWALPRWLERLLPDVRFGHV